MSKICDWYRDNSCDCSCNGLDTCCKNYSGDLCVENIISTNLREDRTLEIYYGNELMCTIEDGREDEDFVEDILFGMGYQWNEDGTITQLYNNCDDN